MFYSEWIEVLQDCRLRLLLLKISTQYVDDSTFVICEEMQGYYPLIRMVLLLLPRVR